MSKKPLVAYSDSLVTSATNSTQDNPTPVRLDLWLEAKEWYKRNVSIQRACGDPTFQMTMADAYNDVVRLHEEDERLFSQAPR